MVTDQNQQKKPQAKTTSGASSLHRRMTRQLAGIMAHLEHHPNDKLSLARVAKINDILRHGE